ncbi:unnamed protein product [Nesidiocoris tenuis]|uniref:Uncharacterized protein n=1 Tax=Nesidiocoris tenuis TaxID=355587 RepID=A0A6H5FUR9_9HEMI|nr:unnamed protein product [Nesidiocoris tenuis]
MSDAWLGTALFILLSLSNGSVISIISLHAGLRNDISINSTDVSNWFLTPSVIGACIGVTGMEDISEVDAVGLGCSLERFNEWQEVYDIIDNLEPNDGQHEAKIANYEKDYYRFRFIVDQYKEQPHLLDPYLEEIVSKIIKIATASDVSDDKMHQAFNGTATVAQPVDDDAQSDTSEVDDQEVPQELDDIVEELTQGLRDEDITVRSTCAEQQRPLSKNISAARAHFRTE